MNGATAVEHDVAAALGRVRADIARFAERHGREPGSVALLAIGKTKPTAMLRAAVEAGQRDFGENYVDEALGKIDALGHSVDTSAEATPRGEAGARVPPGGGRGDGSGDGDAPAGGRDGAVRAGNELVWHFVGGIQSRRCQAIAERFDWAHGVDREKVARRLSERRPEALPPLNVCLQLNVDGEASKGGVPPEELDALADACATLPGIHLRGLMAIPAPRRDFDGQRRAFAAVRERFESLRTRGHDALDTLSIGMSGDLEAAIAEGATLVRVGTAVFGERAARKVG